MKCAGRVRLGAAGLALACLAAAGRVAAQPVPSEIVGDPDAGRRLFVKCRSCHQIGDGAVNQIGPVLSGVVGRPAGTYPGYSYSSANKGSGLVWDETTLRAYLHDPKALVPGTRMMFAGVRSDREIDDLLAFLRGFGPDGRPRSQPPSGPAVVLPQGKADPP